MTDVAVSVTCPECASSVDAMVRHMSTNHGDRHTAYLKCPQGCKVDGEVVRVLAGSCPRCGRAVNGDPPD